MFCIIGSTFARACGVWDGVVAPISMRATVRGPARLVLRIREGGRCPIFVVSQFVGYRMVELSKVGWAMGLFGGAGLRCWCSVEVIEVWSSWAARMTLGGQFRFCVCMLALERGMCVGSLGLVTGVWSVGWGAIRRWGGRG